MAVWLFTIIGAVIRRNFCVKISPVKIVTISYGVIVGFLLPYETDWYFLGVIPAAAVSSIVMQLQNVRPSILWPYHWEYHVLNRPEFIGGSFA